MGLLAELKRRNVYRAGLGYLVAAWLLLQIVDVVGGIVDAPQWLQQGVLALLVAGFPLALVLAWVYEWTPDGLKVDARSADGAAGSASRRRAHNRIIVTLLVAALGVMLVDRFLLGPATAPAPVPGTSVAVLPFENRSADAEDAFFVEGIHDDVLLQLGRINALSVISRTSVRNVVRGDLTTPEIGALLGATAILEGAVQRAGDRVRITVQLVDAAADRQVWSDRYDRQLDAANMFEIQSEIASNVAQALRATLTPGERERLESRPTDSLEAYLAYLRGREQLDGLTAASIAAAQAHFREALALDPAFALAHVGLANALMQEYQYGEGQDAALIEAAGDAVAQALALDDGLAEAYAARAAIRHDQEDYAQAEADVEVALELNPNLARARSLYAELLHGHAGRKEAGYAEIRRAIESEPRAVYPRRVLFGFLLADRRNDEAREEVLKLREFQPENAASAAWLGIITGLMLGNFVDPLQLMLEAVRLDPDNPTYSAWTAASLMEAGKIDAAMAWSKYALDLGPQHYEPNDVAMFAHMYAGNEELAIEYARRAVELGPRYPSAVPLAMLAGNDFKNGETEAALRRYQSAYPELFGPDAAADITNYRAAVDVAYLLRRSGNEARAQALFDDIAATIEPLAHGGFRGLFFHGARFHAATGDVTAALDALEDAYANNVQLGWQHIRDHDYLMAGVRGHPRFADFAARFDARLNEARRAVDRLIADGFDINPPGRAGTASH